MCNNPKLCNCWVLYYQAAFTFQWNRSEIRALRCQKTSPNPGAWMKEIIVDSQRDYSSPRNAVQGYFLRSLKTLPLSVVRGKTGSLPVNKGLKETGEKAL